MAGPVGRNVDALIRQIKAVQAVAANPGRAAPAGWKAGDELIGTGQNFYQKILAREKVSDCRQRLFPLLPVAGMACLCIRAQTPALTSPHTNMHSA